MPPVVINLRKTDDSRDVVHRAVQALVEGKLVVFPTETSYVLGASARATGAVEQLAASAAESAAEPIALGIRSAEDALDFAPRSSRRAERLARRCWPGPVTLLLPHGDDEGLVRQLPMVVRSVVAPNGEVALRVPAHEIVLDVLRMHIGPIVMAVLNGSGDSLATTAESAVQLTAGKAALLLDDGPCRYGQSTTVVRVNQNGIECIREGVVPRGALERLSGMYIVFVCTGNTCRSPMAEAIMRRLLAERLGCKIDEVESRGVVIESAGVAASAGSAASPEAVEVMRQQGLDISHHASQPMTEKLVRQADLILTLTAAHRQALLRRWPEAAPRTMTLRPDNRDVEDPIGGPVEMYRQCAAEIESALRQRVAKLEIL
jgi:protein-tyrosine phosphatase